MTKFINKLKSFFLYGGLKDKEEYDSVSSLVIKQNLSIWRVMSLLVTILCIVSIFTSFAIEEMRHHIYFYIINAALSFLIHFVLEFASTRKNNKHIINVCIYMQLAAALALGMYLGLSNHLDWPSTTFIVLLVIGPSLIAGRPLFNLLIIIIASVTYCIIVSYVKVGAAFQIDLYNTLSFEVASIAIAFFSNASILKGFLARHEIDRLAKQDALTGLENELSYVTMTQEIDDKIEKGEMEDFGIVMMDVNGVKPTNDTYGHVYGCSLIVEAGHYIKKHFKTSRCFHVGGDEYIVKLEGEDLQNIEKLLEEFVNKMDDYFITKNGITLRVSVAHGLSHFDKNKDKQFSDVLSRADKKMYTNKKIMKEKYHIASRKED